MFDRATHVAAQLQSSRFGCDEKDAIASRDRAQVSCEVCR
jgi:hypothetical protein